MQSWHSYPSIYNLGHRAVENLLTVSVNVEEKIDGSQFSFGVDEAGEVRIRSKGQMMNIDAPEKMFEKAAETVKWINRFGLLHPGWTYRGEFLAKPKHNSLAYARVPTGHIAIFDVNTGEADYLPYEAKRIEAERIGLECTPLLFSGVVTSAEFLKGLLERESVLGGQKIEGVVIKPSDYSLFGQDKKAIFGKFVSEHFKEVHKREWKTSNPTNRDVLLLLGDQYASPARWQKAVIHLRELGLLEDSPKDIGAILKEIPSDILSDSEQDIKDALFKWAWPHVRRMATRGFPEWYKEQLLSRQFETTGP